MASQNYILLLDRCITRLSITNVSSLNLEKVVLLMSWMSFFWLSWYMIGEKNEAQSVNLGCTWITCQSFYYSCAINSMSIWVRKTSKWFCTFKLNFFGLMKKGSAGSLPLCCCSYWALSPWRRTHMDTESRRKKQTQCEPLSSCSQWICSLT